MTKEILLLDEYELLLLKKVELEQALKSHAEDLEDAMSQSSETRHDNAPGTYTANAMNNVSILIQKVNSKLNNAQVYDCLQKSEMAQVGSCITYFLNGTHHQKTIGGHLDGLISIKDRISLASPIAKAIIGKKVGDSFEYSVGTKKITGRIVEIV